MIDLKNLEENLIAIVIEINSKRETSTSTKLQIAKPKKNKNNSSNLKNLIENKNIDNNSIQDEIPDNMKYLYTYGRSGCIDFIELTK